MIECRRCGINNSKWKIINRFPLQDISDKLPEKLKNKGFQEFYCPNVIRKVETNIDIIRICGNHIIIRKSF